MTCACIFICSKRKFCVNMFTHYSLNLSRDHVIEMGTCSSWSIDTSGKKVWQGWVARAGARCVFERLVCPDVHGFIPLYHLSISNTASKRSRRLYSMNASKRDGTQMSVRNCALIYIFTINLKVSTSDLHNSKIHKHCWNEENCIQYFSISNVGHWLKPLPIIFNVLHFPYKIE